MRLYIVLLFCASLLLGSALAQSDAFASMPECAVDCFQNLVSQSKCNPTDFGCLCTDTTFTTAVQGCEAKNCTVKETLTATNATVALCGTPADNATPTVIAIPATFGTIALLMVAMRIVDRFWSKKLTLEWDDYFVVMAMLLALPMNFLCFPMANLGMGKDLWTLTFPHITETLRLLYVIEIFYMPAEMFVQLSLLAFYIRIFNNAKFKKFIWALMGLVLCFGIANTFAIIFQCTPVSFFWNGWTGEVTGKCININLFSWIRAAIEIAIDVTIIVLPLPLLLKLQMTWKKKTQVLSMFSVGFVITLISILRLRSLIKFAKSSNVTFDNAPGIYWSVLECDIFIICACMPSMRTFFQKLAPSWFGNSAQNSGYGYTDRMSRNDLGKAGYQRQTSSQRHAHHPSSKTGGIMKSVDVDLYRTQRSDSDIELVDPARPNGYGAWTTTGHN